MLALAAAAVIAAAAVAPPPAVLAASANVACEKVACGQGLLLARARSLANLDAHLQLARRGHHDGEGPDRRRSRQFGCRVPEKAAPHSGAPWSACCPVAEVGKVRAASAESWCRGSQCPPRHPRRRDRQAIGSASTCSPSSRSPSPVETSRSNSRRLSRAPPTPAPRPPVKGGA